MEGWAHKGSRVRGFGAHHVGNAQTRRLTVERRRGDIGPNFECRNVPKYLCALVVLNGERFIR